MFIVGGTTVNQAFVNIALNNSNFARVICSAVVYNTAQSIFYFPHTQTIITMIANISISEIDKDRERGIKIANF